MDSETQPVPEKILYWSRELDYWQARAADRMRYSGTRAGWQADHIRMAANDLLDALFQGGY